MKTDDCTNHITVTKNNITAAPWQTKLEDTALSELGHLIFFDKNFSANGTKSCASCHAPELAFTDGYRRSLGIEADLHRRNSPTLLNIGELKVLNWADPNMTDLAAQAEAPLFGHTPKELGLQRSDSVPIFAYLRQATAYKLRLAPYRDSLSWRLVLNALAAYTQGLTSLNANYYNANVRHTYTLTAAEAQGKKLFFSDELKCATCHSLPYFTNASWWDMPYYNIGLYRDYPPTDLGLYESTHDPHDKGKFRAPTLYNVALTAPYMHDGSVATLGEAIDIFARGGRNVTYGAHRGDGKRSKNKDRNVTGFRLTPDDRAALLAFLGTLTDTSFLAKPYFRNLF